MAYRNVCPIGGRCISDLQNSRVVQQIITGENPVSFRERIKCTISEIALNYLFFQEQLSMSVNIEYIQLTA